MPLRSVTLDQLTIDNEASLAHVALYGQLKAALRKSGHRFLVPGPDQTPNWDRALFLNLTFWGGPDAADVLCDDHIPADVVCHVALHHVVGSRLAAETAPGPPSSLAVLFAEVIASAFDLFLVGRLLNNVPDSDFISTQVPILGEVAEEAGLPEEAFAALLSAVADAPERAFEDLRALLFDVVVALLPCRTAGEAEAVLEGVSGHRFAPLLHHYQLSNWILYCRAYTVPAPEADKVVQRFDQILREAPVSLDWLAQQWIGA